LLKERDARKRAAVVVAPNNQVQRLRERERTRESPLHTHTHTHNLFLTHAHTPTPHMHTHTHTHTHTRAHTHTHIPQSLTRRRSPSSQSLTLLSLPPPPPIHLLPHSLCLPLPLFLTLSLYLPIDRVCVGMPYNAGVGYGDSISGFVCSIDPTIPACAGDVGQDRVRRRAPVRWVGACVTDRGLHPAPAGRSVGRSTKGMQAEKTSCSTVGIITRAPTGDSARVQMSPCIGVKPNMPASDRYVDFYSRVFVWASSTLRSALPFPSSQLSGPTTHYVLLFLRFRITHHTVCEEYEPSRLGSVYHEDAFCPGHYSVPYSWRYETRRTTEIEWQLYACASRRFYVCC
jgi:hypothetical protein